MNKETEERFNKAKILHLADNSSSPQEHIWVDREEVMTFITSELLLQRAEIIKQIEGQKREKVGTHICFPLEEITFMDSEGNEMCCHHYEVYTHNKALDYILSLLQPNK